MSQTTLVVWARSATGKSLVSGFLFLLFRQMFSPKVLPFSFGKKKQPMLKPDLFCKKCSYRCVLNAAAKTSHQVQLNKINL